MYPGSQQSGKQKSSGSEFFSLINTPRAHPIPELPIIDLVISQITIDLSKSIVVGAQHILETTPALFRALIQAKADPKKIYLTGKAYSTSEPVAATFRNLGIQLMPDVVPEKPGEYQAACRKNIRRMWDQIQTDLRTKHKDVDTILIVDDGFRCFEEMPPALRFDYKVAGVEQTRGGLYSSISNGLPFPLIEVASSAAKRRLEAPMIANAVFRSIQKFLDTLDLQNDTVCGVIGNGAIGEAIASYLLGKGVKVVVYDESPKAFSSIISHSKLYRVDSIESVIINAELVFGCTGTDITKDIDVLNIAKGKRKIFISASSEDREFLTFLKSIADLVPQGTNPLCDIKFTSENGCEILIKNGGYPVNFDREPWNVPAEDIELTQCLMLGSVIQAFTCAYKPVGDGTTVNKTSRHMLNPNLQKFVVKSWARSTQNQEKYSSELITLFENTNWISDNSGGIHHESESLSGMFGEIPEIEVTELMANKMQ